MSEMGEFNERGRIERLGELDQLISNTEGQLAALRAERMKLFENEVLPDFADLKAVMAERGADSGHINETAKRLMSINERFAEGENLPVAVVGSIEIQDHYDNSYRVEGRVPYGTAFALGKLAAPISTFKPNPWEQQALKVDPDVLVSVLLRDPSGYCASTGFIVDCSSADPMRTPLLQVAQAVRVAPSATEFAHIIEAFEQEELPLSPLDRRAAVTTGLRDVPDGGDLRTPLMIVAGEDGVKALLQRLHALNRESYLRARQTIPTSSILSAAITIGIDPRIICPPEWQSQQHELRRQALQDFGEYASHLVGHEWTEYNHLDSTRDLLRVGVCAAPAVSQFLGLEEDELVTAARDGLRRYIYLERYAPRVSHRNGQQYLPDEIADQTISDLLAMYGCENLYPISGLTNAEIAANTDRFQLPRANTKGWLGKLSAKRSK